jgi:hypothetical protein
LLDFEKLFSFPIGNDRNSYYHKLFIRDKEDLAKFIPRLNIKGLNIRRPHAVSDDDLFYRSIGNSTSSVHISHPPYLNTSLTTIESSRIESLGDNQINSFADTTGRTVARASTSKSLRRHVPYRFDTVEHRRESVNRILQQYQQQQQNQEYSQILSNTSPLEDLMHLSEKSDEDDKSSQYYNNNERRRSFDMVMASE